jgi:alpha-N-arabinofuranosidase
MKIAGFEQRGFRVGCIAALTLLFGSVSIRAQEITIRVDAAEPGPQISRYLYGHFLEHLGRAVYDGVWVGADSDIPNRDGLRTDVLEALRDLQPPVIRWPGGCYADEYHWETGIGPRSERPVTVNLSWGGVEETNEFGTHEFFEFVEALGADAYIAGNLGTGSAEEMMRWLEYMTSPTRSTLAESRRANGRSEPWQVPFFGVGNESWGCGGQMRPAYYADLYRQTAEFLQVPGQRLRRIASGGHDALTDWTETLSQIDANIDGISHHYYTTPTGIWAKKGNATGFPEQEWISTLWRALRVEDHIEAQEAVLDRNDPEGNIGIYLDEWGTWYDPTPGASALYQQNTIRDAMVAALHFHVFHRHAERLHMANIAQTVNVLQAMILTEGNAMIVTPTYHLFKMYIPFQDSTFLPVSFDATPMYEYRNYSVPSVSATAARGTDGRLYASVVNLNPDVSAKVALEIVGSHVLSASAEILTGNDTDSHNSFDAPNTVEPEPWSDFSVEGDRLRFDLPAKSIVMISFD